MSHIDEGKKKFTNVRFYNKDFSGKDLSNADFRSATLLECNFKGADLTRANFEGANCWGSDFEDSIMYKTNFKDAVLATANFKPKKCFGITITMSCDAFERTKLSRSMMLYLLYFPTVTVLPDKDVEAKLINTIGQDTYIALTKVFKEQLL